MTVITVVAIAAIAALFVVFVLPRIKNNLGDTIDASTGKNATTQAKCEAAGMTWEGGECK